MAEVYAFADSAHAAQSFAAAAGLTLRWIKEHRFPDGETLIRVEETSAEVFLFRSLHQPTAKIFEVLLAASALRDNGATSITLIAPYLGYMRQDTAFHPGEAVSQKVMGEVLARYVDRIVSIEPHLHRTRDFSTVFPGRRALAVSGASAIAASLGQALPGNTVVLGPDEESATLAEAVAAPMRLRWAVGTKVRHGDRAVTLQLPEDIDLNGRPALIVDDVISSGTTILAVADAARARGATVVEVACVHALYDEAAAREFSKAGIERVRSGDGVPHVSNAMPLAPMLVDKLRQEGWLE
ncbi:MAG: ribose-phosphate diphosphokinase [Sphingomonadales bacterium]|nr:ribose-phosphate diphosphokinase [Sphingomonadales bacterium]